MKKEPKRPAKRTNTTILLVVEGFTEEAFAQHLKDSYIEREMHIALRIKNAKGHGPEGIVDAFESMFKTTSYFDYKGAFYDSDVPASDDVLRYLDKNKITSFVSDPCIEALLIELRGKRPLANTKACKGQLSKMLSGDPTDCLFYGKHFSKDLLEEKRRTSALINDLLTFITRG